MADNKIRIGADTTDIRRSILDISKAVKSLGTSKVSIFDKKDKEFLVAQAKASLKDIKKQMEDNRSALKAALSEQKKVNSSVDDEIKARKKVLDLVQKQVDLQSQMKDVQTLGQMGQGGIAKKLGMGGLGGGLGGMLGKFGPLMALSGLAAVGGFAYSRMSQANDTFKGGVDDRLKLMGRGAYDMNIAPGLEQRSLNAGLNAQSMRRARLAAMDVFGDTGATQQAVLQRSEFERNFGIEQGSMTNIGSQLRGSLGGKEAEKATMAIQASLIASGIEDAIGPYLETSASMLTAINENGISFSDSAMALLSVAAGSKQISAEKAGKFISGIDASIRGSTGETNAFFQQVFGKAGIGGKSLGGVQAAMRSGGLFGADVDKSYISDADKSVFKSLGMKQNQGSLVANNYIKMLDELMPESKESTVNQMMKGNQADKDMAQAARLQRLNITMSNFGLKSEEQAATVERLLKELGSAKTQKEEAKIKKQIENIQAGETDLGNLKMINKSTAAAQRLLEDLKVNTQDVLGEQGFRIFQTIEMTLINIDQLLGTVLSKIPGLETPSQELKNKIETGQPISQELLDKATGGSDQLLKQTKQSIKDEYLKNEQELAAYEKEEAKLNEKAKMGIGYGPSWEMQHKKKIMLQKKEQLAKYGSNFKDLDITKELGIPEIPKATPIMMNPPQRDTESSVTKFMDVISNFTTTLEKFITKDSKVESQEQLKLLKSLNDHASQTNKGVNKIGTLPSKSGKT